MQRKGAHLILPEDLLTEIDLPVGARDRGTFLAKVVSQQIQRRKLLAALRDAHGSWKNKDHPELRKGSKLFVKRLRAANDVRLKSLSP